MRRITRGLQPKSGAIKDNSDSTFNESALLTSKMRDDEISRGTATKPLQLVPENASKEGERGKESNKSVNDTAGHQPTSVIKTLGLTAFNNVLMKGDMRAAKNVYGDVHVKSTQDDASKTEMNGVALVDDTSGGDENSNKISLEALRVNNDQNSWENNGSRNKRSQPESVLDISIDNSLIIARLLNAFAIEAALAKNDLTEAEVAREALQMSIDTDFEMLETKKVAEVVDEVKRFADDVSKRCGESVKPCEGVDIIENEFKEMEKWRTMLALDYGSMFQENSPLSILWRVRDVYYRTVEQKNAIDTIIKCFTSYKADPASADLSFFYKFAPLLSNLKKNPGVFKNPLSAQDLDLLQKDKLLKNIDGLIVLKTIAEEIANRNSTLIAAQEKQKRLGAVAHELSQKYPKEVIEKTKEKLRILTLYSYFPSLPIDARNITHGLPNGATDIGQVFKETKSDFVKNFVLKGSSTEELSYPLLSALHKKIESLSTSLQSGSNMIVAEKSIGAILSGATEDVNEMVDIAKSTNFLQNITVFQGPANIDLWIAEKSASGSILDYVKPFLGKMSNLSPNFSSFTQFLEKINFKKPDIELFFDTLNSTNTDEIVTELNTISQNIGVLLQMKEMASWINSTKIDTLYPEAKTWFETSGAAAAIKTIQTKDNSKKSKKSKRVKRAAQLNKKLSGLKELQKLYPNNKYFVQVLKTKEYVNEWMNEHRKMMKTLNKKIVSQSNQKHSFNVTKPFDVIRQLGFANKFLLDLKKAKSAEEAINKLLKAEKEIDNHINSISDPVLKTILKRSWTPEKKRTLRQLSGIIKQLEKKITQVPNTLEGYGELFKSDENLDGLSDVNLAEFVDLLLQTECPSVGKVTGEKLKGLNLEFANGKLKMKQGLEAFVQALPFLGGLAAPAIFHSKKQPTTETPEAVKETFAKRPITRETTVYKDTTGKVYVAPKSMAPVDESQTSMKPDDPFQKELDVTQSESYVEVKDEKELKEYEEVIKESEKLAEEQDKFRLASYQIPSYRKVYEHANHTFDTVQTFFDDEVENGKVSKERLVFQHRAKVVYFCGKGVDIFKEDNNTTPLKENEMIKTANNIILQKAEPDMYTARDLDEVSTKLPSEKKTKLTSSGEETEPLMSEGQRTTGGADIQYEERIPPKIETRWCHEPVQVMNAHGKGLPSETNELDEIEPDNENLKDFFPQGIRTNEEIDFKTLAHGMLRKEFILREAEQRRKPTFSKNFLIELLQLAAEKHKSQPALLKINRKITRIVGDIHGNYDDLIRQISLGLADKSTFVFSGDYVDRGTLSAPIYLLFSQMAKNQRVHLLRGNHELAHVNIDNGFFQECIDEYGETGGREIWLAANAFFAELPVACILNEKIFVAHGGISRLMLKGKTVLNDIKKTPKTPFEWKLFIDILWNDPSELYPSILTNSLVFPKNRKRVPDSDLFTPIGLVAVLDALGLECVIRGHQVVQNGYEPFCGTRCITNYGATNNSKNNNAAQTIVHDNTVEFIRFRNMNEQKKPDDDLTQVRKLHSRSKTKSNSKTKSTSAACAKPEKTKNKQRKSRTSKSSKAPDLLKNGSDKID
ncbi:hypothetical protein CRE_09541 [Caenorhabditis remanei]|uniref:Serine/threonine-protein phosphatase n=1 Tax=Caenorhabditis remanei TaxID=31234 RepID=E3MJ25_CAERE|nr:hypothetical protein CRE_09541 [Caenorhabditis remanei]